MRALPKLRTVSLLSSALLACCTGSRAPYPPPVSPSHITHGGHDIVLGALEWPECLNPITSCAEAEWTWFSLLDHVLPKAMELGPDGRYRNSPLLTEAPSQSNGGLSVQSSGRFTVTFL